jgi:hypothetical protein
MSEYDDQHDCAGLKDIIPVQRGPCEYGKSNAVRHHLMMDSDKEGG